MKKASWKRKIRESCVAAGTYKDYFELVIAELAGILERRDAAVEEYAEDPRPVISYTNKADATNTVKNPLLVLIDDMNKTALAYWRDLGLTPAGLKKINERTFKESEDRKGNSLLERLAELRGEQNG